MLSRLQRGQHVGRVRPPLRHDGDRVHVTGEQSLEVCDRIGILQPGREALGAFRLQVGNTHVTHVGMAIPEGRETAGELSGPEHSDLDGAGVAGKRC